MPVVLAMIIAGAYIINEVSKEHRQMHGAPTQQEREWREAMNATNRNHEKMMEQVRKDDEWRRSLKF